VKNDSISGKPNGIESKVLGRHSLSVPGGTLRTGMKKGGSCVPFDCRTKSFQNGNFKRFGDHGSPLVLRLKKQATGELFTHVLRREGRQGAKQPKPAKMNNERVAYRRKNWGGRGFSVGKTFRGPLKKKPNPSIRRQGLKGKLEAHSDKKETGRRPSTHRRKSKSCFAGW